jgi:hypothetical protein
VWDPETETWYELSGMPSHLQGSVITLNKDADAQPDVIGDINKAPFSDRAFQRVFFENVEWPSFAGVDRKAIDESARMLNPGGQLVIETGSGVIPYLNTIRERMHTLGFKYIRITQQKNGRIRISGRLGGPE